MNRPTLRFRVRLAGLVAGGALVAALFPMAGTALAAPPAVTPASGGGAISLDKSSASPGTGTYTTLSGPVISENGTGVFSTGTIVLTAPSGFEFNPLAGTVGKTGDCVITALTMAAGTATLSISTASTTTACVITFSGLGVRPTGTTTASGTIAESGTATGLPGGSYGALASVLGAPILTFTQQPSATGTGGVVLGQQPKVKSADRFGNERVSDPVTLAVQTSPSGGTVTCTTNPVSTVDVAGQAIAAFAGCYLDKAGPYTLRATTPVQGGSIPVTDPISISVGGATKLVFYQQPQVGVAGVAFPTQPIVGVADAGGNILPSGFSGTVSLAIANNPGSGTLTCTSGLSVSTQLTSAGVLASFAGCRINNAGLGYTLTASSGGLTSVTSPALDIENQMVFYTQPSGAVAGVAFTSQPSVAVQVNSAIAVNDSSTVVTLSIRSGTGAAGATLTCSGGLSKTVASGVATFSGCAIDKLSPTLYPYQLVASTATGLGTVTSSSFAVTVGPVTKVGFIAQPADANVSAVFPVSPVVAIQDAGGNVITTGGDSIRVVSLAIGTNPGGGTLTCSGGLARAAVAGIATFTGCSIDRTGSGYTLTASSTSLTSATSAAFNVTAPAAQITLTTSAPMPRGAKDPVITWGQGITLGVQFAANGAGRTIQLQGTRDGVNWVTITNLTMGSLGNSSFAYTPVTNLWYRAVFAGTTDLSAATSNQVRTVVREIALLRPTNGGSVRSISRNTSVTFTTTVRPARPELAPARVTFWFYHQVNGSWVLAAKRDVVINAAGLANNTFAFTSSGQWYVRLAANPTPYNANSVMSPVERYSVY